MEQEREAKMLGGWLTYSPVLQYQLLALHCLVCLVSTQYSACQAYSSCSSSRLSTIYLPTRQLSLSMAPDQLSSYSGWSLHFIVIFMVNIHKIPLNQHNLVASSQRLLDDGMIRFGLLMTQLPWTWSMEQHWQEKRREDMIWHLCIFTTPPHCCSSSSCLEHQELQMLNGSWTAEFVDTHTQIPM